MRKHVVLSTVILIGLCVVNGMGYLNVDNDTKTCLARCSGIYFGFSCTFAWLMR